jgi:hypothetical protein
MRHRLAQVIAVVVTSVICRTCATARADQTTRAADTAPTTKARVDKTTKMPADQTPKACDPSAATPTFAWADAAAPIVITPLVSDDTVTATTTVTVRNESTWPMDGWCGRPIFTDFQMQPIQVGLRPAPVNTQCVALGPATSLPPGAIGTLDLAFDVPRTKLPVSGVIIVSAKTCTGAKQLTRQLTITAPALSPEAARLPLEALAFSAAFFVLCVICLFRHLLAPMGASVFAPTSSLTTNVTVVGTLVTSFMSSTALPEYPHLATRTVYVVLGLIFGLAVLLAPVLYNFGTTPVSDTERHGRVWWFLVSVAVTIWAVAGQIGVLILLLCEFADRLVISGNARNLAIGVLLAVAAAAAVYCFRTAAYYARSATASAQAAAVLARAVAPAPARPPTWNVL